MKVPTSFGWSWEVWVVFVRFRWRLREVLGGFGDFGRFRHKQVPFHLGREINDSVPKRS